MPGDRQSQIDQLVRSALALDPGERASYLAEACADPAVLEEVSRTLAIRLESSSDSHAPRDVPAETITQPAVTDHRLGQIYGIYQINRRIGSGGMGEVYLAFDTRLGREVALKFLPAKTSGDETLVRRFQSEARSASSLNHPNILTIFDVGKFGSDHYIASEYVEGMTLRARLRRGPLDLAEAVEVATQVASALMAAHSAGVIHRDLKPTNIMLRPDGYVKVIDFGLAKRLQRRDSSPADEAYTKPGTMVGTVDYMSPEQARGEEVDARTDLWALGIVFYEMLAGRRPFEGQSQFHVLAQILDSEPKPASPPGTLPPIVEQVLKRCLTKDRDARYASAAELYADLKEARRALNLSSTTQQATAAPPRPKPWLRAAGIASLVCLLAAGWWWMAWGKDWLLGPDVFDHTMKRVTFKGQIRLAAISPDGQYLAFVNGTPSQELGIKQLDSSSEAALIPRANILYTGITFSNDGRYVYYVTRSQERGQLRRIALPGGDSAFVADDVDGPVAMGPREGAMAFRRDVNKLAYVVLMDSKPGEERLTAGDADGLDNRISWSARTNRIAIFKYPPAGGTGMRLALLNPDTLKTGPDLRIPAWRGVSQSVWMDNGHDLIVATETQDEAEDSMQLRAISTLNGRTRNVTADSYAYHGASISADGNKLVTVRWDRQTRFWVIPSANLNEGGPIRAADSGLYSSVSWTDDNKLITQANRGEGTNIWLVDPDNGRLQKLTSGVFIPRDPVWLRHGRAIIYAADRNGLWQTDAGDGATHLLTRAPGYIESPSCTPDGRLIVYTVWEPHEPSVWAQPPAGGAQGARLLLHNARHPIISPDGRNLVVERSSDTAEGGWQAALYSFDDMQFVRSIPHIPAGSRLRWQPDGSALTYIVTDSDGTSNIWSQPLAGGAPRRLTSFREDQIFDYAWSADGNQLVCLRGTTVSDAFLLTRKRSMLGRLIAWINPNSMR
jgi:Tol biopolymer transport system component